MRIEALSLLQKISHNSFMGKEKNCIFVGVNFFPIFYRRKGIFQLRREAFSMAKQGNYRSEDKKVALMEVQHFKGLARGSHDNRTRIKSAF